MSPIVRKRTIELIQEYELHTRTPVRLDSLDDLFTVRYVDMAMHGMMGAVLTPPHGWPVSPDNRARMLLDYSLSDHEARVTMAHEVGHAICQHHGTLSSLALGLEDKHERQAWAVASMILIPDRVVYEEREAERVAAVCEVPLFMVELWQSVRG